ncbi:MAG: peptidase MA family metallohydrolase [Candidatus Zhuqueibacterota bacterium]
MLKKTRAVLPFLILLFTPIFSYTQRIDWRVKSVVPFYVYFQENDQANADFVLKTCVSAQQKLAAELQTQLDDSITIFLSPSQQIFQQMVGQHIPKWSNGLAAPFFNVIVLKSPSWLSPENDIRAIIVHELTHLFVNKAAGSQPVPRWLNEGLAIYYSGEKAYASGSQVSKALLTGSLVELSDIDDVLEFHQEKAQLAYQQSYLAVVYLIGQYQLPAVMRILSEISSGKTGNDAFLTAIGIDLWDFEDDWVEYVRSKFRWNFLIDFDTYFWILLLLLFILVLVFIRRRNRKTLQRWESEDSDLE